MRPFLLSSARMPSALAPHFSLAVALTAAAKVLALSLPGSMMNTAEWRGSPSPLTVLASNSAGNARRTLTNLTFIFLVLSKVLRVKFLHPIDCRLDRLGTVELGRVLLTNRMPQDFPGFGWQHLGFGDRCGDGHTRSPTSSVSVAVRSWKSSATGSMTTAGRLSERGATDRPPSDCVMKVCSLFQRLGFSLSSFSAVVGEISLKVYISSCFKRVDIIAASAATRARSANSIRPLRVHSHSPKWPTRGLWIAMLILS